MPKFYVQCASIQYLTFAKDARGAALAAVHQFIGQRIDIASIDWTNAETIDRNDMISAMLALDESILVSEIGFGRDDAGTFATAEILSEWNELVIAVSRHESLFRNAAC